MFRRQFYTRQVPWGAASLMLSANCSLAEFCRETTKIINLSLDLLVIQDYRRSTLGASESTFVASGSGRTRGALGDVPVEDQALPLSAPWELLSL